MLSGSLMYSLQCFQLLCDAECNLQLARIVWWCFGGSDAADGRVPTSLEWPRSPGKPSSIPRPSVHTMHFGQCGAWDLSDVTGWEMVGNFSLFTLSPKLPLKLCTSSGRLGCLLHTSCDAARTNPFQFLSGHWKKMCREMKKGEERVNNISKLF